MKKVFLVLTLLVPAAAAPAQDAASEVLEASRAAQAEGLSEDARQQLAQRQVAARLQQARPRTDAQTARTLQGIVPQASIIDACLNECRRQGYEQAVCERGCRRN